jgi:hypothetical protein
VSIIHHPMAHTTDGGPMIAMSSTNGAHIPLSSSSSTISIGVVGTSGPSAADLSSPISTTTSTDIATANHNVRFAPLPVTSPAAQGRSLSVRTAQQSMQIEVSLEQLRSPTSKDLEAAADGDLDSHKIMHPFTLRFQPTQLKHINLEVHLNHHTMNQKIDDTIIHILICLVLGVIVGVSIALF